MMQGKKVVALVPLRGGSKSIPRKNIRPLAGKPLCQYVLEAAAKADGVDEVYVSTEDAEIKSIVLNMGLGIMVIDRPKELANDTASTESVILHFAKNIEFDVLVTLQATSPLTTSKDIDEALSIFNNDGCDSLLTGVRWKRFFWTDDGRPLNYLPKSRPRRQSFSGWIMENGAFYITARQTLEREQCRLGGKIGIFIMDEMTAIEIDEPSDWQKVERLILSRGVKDLSHIKLVISDVDGTLTDSGMYYSDQGEQLKKFSTRDAYGIKKAQEVGIETVLITGENSPIVLARAKKIDIQSVHLGAKDKLSVLKGIMGERGLVREQVAYIGDDENDLECIRFVGYSGCPSDALPTVKDEVDIICTTSGGSGAVREFIETILEQHPEGRRVQP